MRNKKDYEKFLKLKKHRHFIQREIDELESKKSDLMLEMKDVNKELNSLSEYEDMDSDEIRALMPSIVYDSIMRPVALSRGGGLKMPLESFKDSSEFDSLSKYQKSEFKHIESELDACQLSLQYALMEAEENTPNYSVDECGGVSKWCNSVVRQHPKYEELTPQEESEIREIIYKFANHTIQ